jgi:carboxynorspermidine decarboxylase
MPYRPEILGAAEPGALPHSYRLGGLSCLAGDVIGDYAFAEPLKVGQRLVFLDMAHYTMVKTTTFNGVPLPSINLYSEAAGLETVRRFGYEDFRGRLS